MTEYRSSAPKLMGILNVTPDSFSNEGEHFDRNIAVEHALAMVEQGADILDVGGESTRPGAERVSAQQQIDRVIPVIEQVRQKISDNIIISIDTTHSLVAEAAVRAGASMLNDVSAGRDDPGMFELAAKHELPLILMHMQGEPNTMQKNPQYDDVVTEVLQFLRGQAEKAEAAGLSPKQIYIDPGIGFGKTETHNLELIANLRRFVESPYPVLLGASRKRFMRAICQVDDYHELVGGTCATSVYAAMAGVQIIRVHDVKENRQAIDVALALGRHTCS